MLSRISIQINDHIYLKNPESSELGQRIVTGSIDLIDEIGFEEFNFKKLGISIGSPEASIYRYFESKYKVLLYLTNWYWGWVEYRMQFTLANIESAEQRLIRAINLLTSPIIEDSDFSHINEVKLHNIVVCESSKAYLTKQVDFENRYGVFSAYKAIVEQVSQLILEINPSFKCPQMLVTTTIEGAHHQRYFAEHLPRLTNVEENNDLIPQFYQNLVFKTITHV